MFEHNLSKLGAIGGRRSWLGLKLKYLMGCTYMIYSHSTGIESIVGSKSKPTRQAIELELMRFPLQLQRQGIKDKYFQLGVVQQTRALQMGRKGYEKEGSPTLILLTYEPTKYMFVYTSLSLSLWKLVPTNILCA